MPSAARNSLIGGYMPWSEPWTTRPRAFSIAARVAIAVPQTPMKWMRRAGLRTGRGLLEDECRSIGRDQTDVHPQREAQHRRRGRRRVSGGKPEQHRTRKVFREPPNHVGRGDTATRLVAPRQLAKD